MAGKYLSKLTNSIAAFFKMDMAVGIVMILATVIALFFANSGLSQLYDYLLNIPLTLRLAGKTLIQKPLILWINDGLMAIFFLNIGLEIKRELLEGQLSNIKSVVLPLSAAMGGVIAPAALYHLIIINHSDLSHGWAIPVATDIAFALGMLALLGNRVPQGLKLFLVTLAIIDDLLAILIIGVFYSDDLNLWAGSIALVIASILILLNYFKVTKLSVYLLIGIFMWYFVLKSGIHATIAGIVLALTIPNRDHHHGHSPLITLEHALYNWVSFLILPVFAFFNAGVAVLDLKWTDITHPLSLAIMLGLFLGKQFGVFAFAYAAVKFKLARLPKNVTWGALYGVCILCGIGFTMSLFISSLAFDAEHHHLVRLSKVGILLGSLLSTVFGLACLHYCLKHKHVEIPQKS